MSYRTSIRLFRAGYQTTFHSEALQGVGHWEGAVFQQQFATALQVLRDFHYGFLFLYDYNI